MYRSGFCRFSHARYSNAMEDLVDMEKHLTNVAIQARRPCFPVTACVAALSHASVVVDSRRCYSIEFRRQLSSGGEREVRADISITTRHVCTRSLGLKCTMYPEEKPPAEFEFYDIQVLAIGLLELLR